MKKFIAIAIFLLCLGLAIYYFQKADAPKPPIQFESAYLNQQIRLAAPKHLSSYKTGDLVALLLLYNTKNQIVFPNNFNLRIFIRENDQWLEIKESPTERSPENIVLSPETPLSYGQMVAFFPALDDLTKTYQMRVYVFGDMTTVDGVKRVGAFVDFVLTP